jgi:hypothetical protein
VLSALIIVDLERDKPRFFKYGEGYRDCKTLSFIKAVEKHAEQLNETLRILPDRLERGYKTRL